MQSVFPMFFQIKKEVEKHKCFISLPMSFHSVLVGGGGKRDKEMLCTQQIGKNQLFEALEVL